MEKQAGGGFQNKTSSKKLYKCPICNDPQHMKTLASGENVYDRALTTCPRWNRANSSEKGKILNEVQAIPMDICKNLF